MASAAAAAGAADAQTTVMQLLLTDERLQLEQSRIDRSTLQSSYHRLEAEVAAAKDDLKSVVEERERTVSRYKCLLEESQRELIAKQDECEEYKREELMRNEIYQKVEKLFHLKLEQMSADVQNAGHDFNRVSHELSLCEAELDQEKRECVTAIEDLKRRHDSEMSCCEMEIERLRHNKQCVESSDLTQQLHQLEMKTDQLHRKVNDLKLQKSDHSDAITRQQTKNQITEQETHIKQPKGERRLRMDEKEWESVEEGVDSRECQLLDKIHELENYRNVLKAKELGTHFQLNLSNLRLEKTTECHELERRAEELRQNLNVGSDELKALKTHLTSEQNKERTLSQQLQTKLDAEWKNLNCLLNEKIELETKLEKLERTRLEEVEEHKRQMEAMQERTTNADQAKEEAEHQAETYRVQLESQRRLLNKMQMNYSSSTFDFKLQLSCLDVEYQSRLSEELTKVERRLSVELHNAKTELIKSQTDWIVDRQQMQKDNEDLLQELAKHRRQSINNLRFYKGRLKIWKILEKKFKQNLEVLRSDLSQLKIEKESTGYERPAASPETETRRQFCELIEKHRQFSAVLLPTAAAAPANPGLLPEATDQTEGRPDLSVQNQD